MLTKKFKETLKYEGSVSLTSWGAAESPHVTGTWISYLQLTSDERILAPAATLVQEPTLVQEQIQAPELIQVQEPTQAQVQILAPERIPVQEPTLAQEL